MESLHARRSPSEDHVEHEWFLLWVYVQTNIFQPAQSFRPSPTSRLNPHLFSVVIFFILAGKKSLLLMVKLTLASWIMVLKTYANLHWADRVAGQTSASHGPWSVSFFRWQPRGEKRHVLGDHHPNYQNDHETQEPLGFPMKNRKNGNDDLYQIWGVMQMFPSSGSGMVKSPKKTGINHSKKDTGMSIPKIYGI